MENCGFFEKLIYFVLFQVGSHYVASACLELLGSSDSHASAFQVAGTAHNPSCSGEKLVLVSLSLFPFEDFFVAHS